MSPEEAARQVLAERGLQAMSFEGIAGSVANVDLVGTLGDGEKVLVKIGPADELAAEAWTCRRLDAAGLPVPPVVALRPSPDEAEPDHAVLVLGFVAGSPSDAPEVARAAGAMFRRVHAMTLPGWGLLTPQVDGSASGRHDTWADALHDDLAGVHRIVHAGIVDAPLAAAACDLVLGEGGPTAYDGPGVLLHRDLKVQHLFGVEEHGGPRLSSVIDWGFAGVGDPEVDLARLSMAGPAVLDAFLDGYGAEQTDALARRLARYRIWWDLSTLIYEHAAGGTYVDPYRNRVATDVKLLRS